MSETPVPATPAATVTPATVSAVAPAPVTSLPSSLYETARADVAKVEGEVGFLKANWGKLSAVIIAIAVVAFLVARCV